MAMPHTDFINGSFLSFPIETYVPLFAVLNKRTKRGFFDEIQKLDGKDGEGMDPDQLIGLFHVGLMPYKSGITFNEAHELVQEYIFANGIDALNIKLVDAFCDSGLSDRKAVAKQRKMIEELNRIQDARDKAFIKQSWVELDKLNAAIQKISEDLAKAAESNEVGETSKTDAEVPLESNVPTC